MSREETSQVQLSVLDRFARTCEANGLAFFLYFGSLLGAVRHQGFIPWDDDIDVAMPRRDYNQLINIDWGMEGLGLVSPLATPKCPYPFTKVHDQGTLVYEHIDYAVHGLGVNIDVFPIDADWNPTLGGTMARALLRAALILLPLKTVRLARRRHLAKNVPLAFGKILLSPLPIGWLTRYADRLAQSCSEPRTRAGCKVDSHRKAIPLADVAQTVTLPFENRLVPAPVGYHRVLSALYGDYMTPPPDAGRESHHAFRAYRVATTGRGDR